MTKNNKFSWEKVQKPFFVMAPMDGITSSPFRRVCKKLGADVVFSEMIAAEAVYYKSKKTLDMMRFHEDERPIIVQIFGNDTEKMGYSAKWIEENIKPDGIDINMGCPAKKVVSGGRGSALLKDPDRAVEVAKAVREATKLPLSVKIRLGWEKFDVQDLVVRLEKAGVDAITVHGRTKKQGFTGEPDLDAMKEIKNLVKIPVIGNGGVKSVQDACKMLDVTGCDGVMVARGALGNPWIFRGLSQFAGLNTPGAGSDSPGVCETSRCHSRPHSSFPRRRESRFQSINSSGSPDYHPSWDETVEMALWHLQMSLEEFGPKKGIFDMRKHYGWYFKGFDGASELRKKLVRLETPQEIEKLLRK